MSHSSHDHTMRQGRYRHEEGNSSRQDFYRSNLRTRTKSRSPDHHHQRDVREHRHALSKSRSRSRSPRRSPRRERTLQHNEDTQKRVDQQHPERPPQREVIPSPSLILRGLTANVNDGMIYQVLSSFRPLHIRIMYHKITGASRGFAFVDFDSIASASAVMKAYASEPLILDHNRVLLAYSESPSPNVRLPLMDWICDQCQATNFARRTECFKCQAPKSAYAVEMPAQQVPSRSGCFSQSGFDVTSGYFGGEEPVETPSQVLAVRMIPLDVDENELHTVFGSFEGLQSIRLIRDRLTNASRGFCFVEFDTVQRATEVLYASQGMQMRNMMVQVGFARDTYHTRRLNPSWVAPAPNAIASAALEQAQWAFNTHHHVQPQSTQPSDETEAAVSLDDVNALLESAAAAARPTVETPKKPWPLPFENAGGMYNYVTEYGLYYDPDSMCYYDPSSKLYYNQFGGKYYRYNTTTLVFDEYIPPVPIDDTTPLSNSKPSSGVADKTGINNILQLKTKAKKTKPIAFGLKVSASTVTTATVFQAATAEMKEEEAAALAAQTMVGPHRKIVTVGGPAPHLKKKSALDIAKWSQVQRTGGQDPVAETVTTSAEEEETVTQAPICLLCRRKFASIEQLQKHETKSKLHAENLAKVKQDKEIVAAQYRDQEAREAKRQRLDNSAVSASAASVSVVETSTVAPAPTLESGIGAKMLKMMGWKKGDGLGKHGTGITAPVAASGNSGSDTTGLGAKSAIASLDLSDVASYKERLQKMARARYDATT